jgi:hypothetical protein
LADANEAIPPAIDTLIKDCLAQDRDLRLASAADFIKRIRSALRSDVPLSTLLTEARLHEVIAALRQMSAEDFSLKPKGQRLLLVNRLKDLVRINKPELQTATAQMIALLTRLARRERSQDYMPIINAAFDWGFKKLYGTSWTGQPEIREALIDAAKAASAEAHQVMSEEFSLFLSNNEPCERDERRWYFHDLRVLVTALLANPACGDTEAENLAGLYDRLNVNSHVVHL